MIRKESKIRELSKIKDNTQFAKCWSIIAWTEAYKVLSARQIAEIIDSINDRATVNNWIYAKDCPGGFNPKYTEVPEDEIPRF